MEISANEAMASMTITGLKVEKACNWKNQKERVFYLFNDILYCK